MEAKIHNYVEQKNAEAKANSEKGLGTLINLLAGGVGGFVTGGPLGGLIGIGSGALKSMGGPAIDTQTALAKFKEWKNLSYGSDSGGWANFNWTPGG